jgi:hypothetical protein
MPSDKRDLCPARASRPGDPKRWASVTQTGDVYKKRKPLIHLEEGSAKVTNKFAKDVQARNLELSVQACLWLCRKNQAASLESEEKEKEAQSEEKHPRASKEVGRSKTLALAFQKPKARDRFERKKTTDLRLRKSYIKKDSTDQSGKESTGGSEQSAEEKKLTRGQIQTKVKKTGRGRPIKASAPPSKLKKKALTRKVKTHIKLRYKKYK